MTTQNMPVLALRGLTAFPGQTLSFDAEREISILALENAMEGDRELLLVTQREIGVQDPQEEDLYEIGTVCRIFQIVKTSDTGVRVIAGGLHRAALRRLWQTKPFLQANVELLEDQSWRASDRTEALTRRTYALWWGICPTSWWPPCWTSGTPACWRTPSPPTSTSGTRIASGCCRSCTPPGGCW